MPFGLPLFGWSKPETAKSVGDDVELGDAVSAIINAKMGILRETLKAREAFLRASAAQTDSKLARAELLARASEVAFVLGTVEK